MNTSSVRMLSTGGWVLPSVLLFAGILNGSSRPQEVYLPTFPLQYMLAKNTEMKDNTFPISGFVWGAGDRPGPEPGLGPGGAHRGTRAPAYSFPQVLTESRTGT